MGLSAGLDVRGKSRLAPGFDPRTVQLFASRYTDYAISSHLSILAYTFFPNTIPSIIYSIIAEASLLGNYTV